MTLSNYNFALNTDIGAPFVTSLLWAKTEGAAQRVVNAKIELDTERGEVIPPPELLPASCVASYGALVAALESGGFNRRLMETASYRGTDGLFVVRKVTAHPFTYYFRRHEHDNNETPFAVEFSLIGK